MNEISQRFSKLLLVKMFQYQLSQYFLNTDFIEITLQQNFVKLSQSFANQLLSRRVAQHSPEYFMRKSVIQQDIVFPNIGKDHKLESVGCFIKLNTSSYEYDPDDRHKIQRLSRILLKNVKQAWLLLQRKTRKYKKRPDSLFIPRALNQGRTQVYKKYLSILKNMKIWSYINLNIPIDNIPCQKIGSSLTNITNRKYRQGFDAFKGYSCRYTSKMNRTAQYFNTDLKQIQQRSKHIRKQLSYDGPVNVTSQTVYLYSQKRVKSHSKNRRQDYQLIAKQTKKKQKKFDFGHQYDQSEFHGNYSNFLSGFELESKEKIRINSRNRFKLITDQRHHYILNEQESCLFCNAINNFDKENKWVSQLVTTQTFLQDQY